MYERVTRVVAYLFICAALVAVTAHATAERPRTYVIVAAALFVVVIARDMLPASVFGRWRIAIEAAAFIVFVSIMIVLTGGYSSPLFAGYMLLICGASLWSRPAVPLLLGAASSAAYAAAVLGPPALVGVAPVPEALLRVGAIVVSLGIVSCMAALVSYRLRSRAEVPRDGARRDAEARANEVAREGPARPSTAPPPLSPAGESKAAAVVSGALAGALHAGPAWRQCGRNRGNREGLRRRAP